MIVTLTMLTSWLAVYWLYRDRLRPLSRFAPLSMPDRTQAFQDEAARVESRNSIFLNLFFGISVGLLVGNFEHHARDNWIIWRISVLLLGSQILGIFLARLLAYLPLDRPLRQTTWSWAYHLRYNIGDHIYKFSFLWGALLTVEATRQVIPWFHGHPAMRLASLLLMVLLAWPLHRLMIYLGEWLLGLHPARNSKLTEMVGELCQTAGYKRPTIYLLPDWGGKISLASIHHRVPILSEYLIEQLDPKELRALITHVVAHLTRRDARQWDFIYFASFVAGVLLLHGVSGFFEWFYDQPYLWILVPLIPTYLLPSIVLRFFRKEEQRADQLGVELLGDPTLMSQTMEKIHRLGQA